MSAQMSHDASDAPSGTTVDVVVNGGGAAGLNGALMLARSRRSVVVIDSGTLRNAPAEAMHGFIVLDGTSPAEIFRRGREQVRAYGGRVVFSEVASAAPADASPDGDPAVHAHPGRRPHGDGAPGAGGHRPARRAARRTGPGGPLGPQCRALPLLPRL